ncbi:MAG: amidohydrolase family protein [Bryobacteraceae bacterium]
MPGMRRKSITPAILIRNARQLLTLRGPKGARRGPELNELGVIPHGAMLIRDGVVEEVGPAVRVENLTAARGAMEISAVGRVVMPGFVDSHTHLMFPPPCPAGEAQRQPESAVKVLLTVTGQRLAWRGRGYLEAMARHGTTTVEAKTGCGPHESAETKVLRVLAALQGKPLDVVATLLFRFSRACVGSPEADWAAAEWMCGELLPKIRRRRLARFADLEWDPQPWRQELFRRFLVAARELGFGCKVHADDAMPAPAVRLAVEQQAVSVDHLEHIGLAEVDALAGSQTVATLLPGASFRSGRYAPARALIDGGAAVALATNFNPCEAPSLNMQTAISLACLAMGMSPAEAISAATVNGAHAIGCADRGLLAYGKLADILILNTSDYRELPEQLGTNLVHLTIKRGTVVYREGEVAEA